MSHKAWQLTFFFSFVVLATAVMILEGIGITPDRYIFVLLVGGLLIGRYHYFVHDFMPFVLILVGYDFLRGFADDLNPRIDYQSAIVTTKWLFAGHIPTIELQKAFYTPNHLQWYDYTASILYGLHFAVPFMLAFLLWFQNRRRFQEFMLGLGILSYIALLAYFIHPTAPPWLAANMGYIPPVTKIFNVVLAQFPERLHLPTVYANIGPNLVAAIPSLHAGYSFLVFLYAIHFYKTKGWLVAPYFLAMWLTIIYLGEHYFIDILIGAICAGIAFKLARYLAQKYHKYIQLL